MLQPLSVWNRNRGDCIHFVQKRDCVDFPVQDVKVEEPLLVSLHASGRPLQAVSQPQPDAQRDRHTWANGNVLLPEGFPARLIPGLLGVAAQMKMAAFAFVWLWCGSYMYVSQSPT